MILQSPSTLSHPRWTTGTPAPRIPLQDQRSEGTGEGQLDLVLGSCEMSSLLGRLGYWSNHVWLIYHLMNSPAFMNKTTKRWLIVTYDLSATRITGERVKSDGEQENNCSQARVDSQEPVIVACSVGHVHQPPQCHYKQHLCHVHALAQCRAREAVCILCKYTYDGSYLC